MDKNNFVKRLIELLLEVEPEYRDQAMQFPDSYTEQRYLLRCLMNVWDPRCTLSEEYYQLQDELLKEETLEKEPVHPEEIPGTKEPGLYLWQGDITRLAADAIVNAANSQMLGCFVPGHSCIDNAIHSAAGLELRDACWQIMKEQGTEEPTGSAKITSGYNLPAKYVLHTVGPIVQGWVTEKDKVLLADCYYSCLKLAGENGLRSVAFCCISTGVFHFPHKKAAEIAVRTCKKYLREHPETSVERIIFNVFKEEDKEIYEQLLGK